MKLSGDTITTETTRVIFHALATAAEKSRRVMRLAERALITPKGLARLAESIKRDAA